MNTDIARSQLASCRTRRVRAKLLRRVHWLCCVLLHTHKMPRTVFFCKGFPPFSPVNVAVPGGTMAQRKIIAKEIKNEILAKVKEGEKVTDLAKQYAVSDKSIYTWLHLETGDQVVSPVQYNRLKRENEELKKLIGELSLKLS